MGVNPDLDSSLVGLTFNSQWLPDAECHHIRQTASFSIDTPIHAVVLSVFGLNTHTQIHTLAYSNDTQHTRRLNKALCYPKGRQHSNGGSSAVLDQGSGDDLQSLGHSAVRPLLDAGQRAGPLSQSLGHSHLHSTAPWEQERFEQHVTTHLHGVLQVPLHLLQMEHRRHQNTEQIHPIDSSAGGRPSPPRFPCWHLLAEWCRLWDLCTL